MRMLSLLVSNLQQQKKNVFTCYGIYYLILGDHLDGRWPILLSFILFKLKLSSNQSERLMAPYINFIIFFIYLFILDYRL